MGLNKPGACKFHLCAILTGLSQKDKMLVDKQIIKNSKSR
jgi:hypothetical protein